MNKIKKSALLLLLASSLLLSGCDVISAQEYDKLENISADFSSIDSGSVSEETIAATSETLTNAENGQIHKTTDENSNSSNEYLPEGISMDDLRNMVQINGKTLTMPTSLNKLMELDNNFSYEAEYIDKDSPLYNGSQTGFYVNVMYNNIIMFTTSFEANEKEISIILDREIKSITFNKKRCQNAQLNINTSCGLGFNSSKENVNDILGMPNDFDYSESNMRYIFKNDEYEVRLFLDIYEKSNTISSFSIYVNENGGETNE